jgi:hypothetical protein
MVSRSFIRYRATGSRAKFTVVAHAAVPEKRQQHFANMARQLSVNARMSNVTIDESFRAVEPLMTK